MLSYAVLSFLPLIALNIALLIPTNVRNKARIPTMHTTIFYWTYQSMKSNQRKLLETQKNINWKNKNKIIREKTVDRRTRKEEIKLSADDLIKYLEKPRK